jgi:hypothetical protein
MSTKNSSPAEKPAAGRKAWVAPRVETLPRLTNLTLATGDAINGGGDVNNPGSSVF